MATLSQRAIRIRTSEGWQDIAIQGAQGVPGPQGIQGIQGIQGPAGPPSPPSGAAGGDLAGTYPNPTLNPAAKGLLLDAQSKNGAADVYAAFTTTQNPIMDRTGAGAQAMQLGYTPTQPVWWDVSGAIGIIQKMDAAYNYCYAGLNLVPADVDGAQTSIILVTQHSAVQQFEGRGFQRMFKLAAGISYVVSMLVQPQGGSWQYYCGIAQLWMSAKAWAR